MISPIAEYSLAVVDKFFLFAEFEVVCEFHTVDYDSPVL
jgi:hypothetical protein